MTVATLGGVANSLVWGSTPRRFIALGAVVFFWLLVSPVMDSAAANLLTEQTQLQLNQETCDAYKKVDAEMNVVYRQITRDHARDRGFIAALKKAQLAWIRYRDADLESIFPGDPRQYGSIRPMCQCMHLAETTKERTRILNQWVEGVAEGDVCAGSVKIK